MADHRAEQILDSIQTLLTGLGVTGSNVARDRVYPIGSTIVSALSIYQGSDDPASTDDQSWNILNSFLTFRIDIQVRLASSTVISQQLNQIRKEIVIALQGTPSLSLAFVVDLIEGSALEPIEEYGDQPIAKQSFNWTVHYERSRADPSA